MAQMALITRYPLNFANISDWRFAEVSTCWRGEVSASQFGFFQDERLVRRTKKDRYCRYAVSDNHEVKFGS